MITDLDCQSSILQYCFYKYQLYKFSPDDTNDHPNKDKAFKYAAAEILHRIKNDIDLSTKIELTVLTPFVAQLDFNSSDYQWFKRNMRRLFHFVDAIYKKDTDQFREFFRETDREPSYKERKISSTKSQASKLSASENQWLITQLTDLQQSLLNSFPGTNTFLLHSIAAFIGFIQENAAVEAGAASSSSSSVATVSSSTHQVSRRIPPHRIPIPPHAIGEDQTSSPLLAAALAASMPMLRKRAREEAEEVGLLGEIVTPSTPLF